MAEQTPQAQSRQAEPDMLPPVLSLAEAAGLDPPRARALLGTKAANLARLVGAGFPVPAGMVVTPAAGADCKQACAQLRSGTAERGGGPGQRFAVRSSAIAGDLAGASFAGQYETVLDALPEELPEALRHVLDSAASARVTAYRQAHPKAEVADRSGSGIAVLASAFH